MIAYSNKQSIRDLCADYLSLNYANASRGRDTSSMAANVAHYDYSGLHFDLQCRPNCRNKNFFI